MTKFILHGGRTSIECKDNDKFFAEIGRNAKNGGLILFNFYAKEEKEWEGLLSFYKERVIRQSKNKKLKFEIAKESTFVKQIKNADVMHIRGGWTPWLNKKLGKYPNLQELFKGKTITGASAGVYTLSKYYFSNDLQKIFPGLGLLNIKSYCHFKPTDSRIASALSKYKEELPLVLLPECKWITINEA